MDKHAKHTEKSVAPNAENPSDNKAMLENASPPKTRFPALKLKRLTRYLISGSPVLYILALIVAAIAVAGNLFTQSQLNTAIVQLGSMSTSLSAATNELETLKATIAKQEEELKKQDEQAVEIIRNVTNLQIKFKVYPTLEETLVQPAVLVPTVQSAVPAATTASAVPVSKPSKSKVGGKK